METGQQGRITSCKLPSPGAPRVIALVGIDGSGKTTQARRLAAWLAKPGSPALYGLNAGGRRSLGRVAQRLGRAGAQQLLGIAGMLVIESILRGLAIAWTLLRARLYHQIAVMDRYTFCQYASIRAHCIQNRQCKVLERLARSAYRLFPRPDVTFLLAVDPAEAYRRIEARGTDHESLEYLTAAMEAYRALPEARDFVVIDANAPPERITRAIMAALAAPTCQQIHN